MIERFEDSQHNSPTSKWRINFVQDWPVQQRSGFLPSDLADISPGKSSVHRTFRFHPRPGRGGPGWLPRHHGEVCYIKLKLINFQFIYLNVTRNSLTHINENQKLDLKSCCIDIVHLQFYMYTIRSNQINTKNLNDFLFLLEKEKLIKSQSCRQFQIWFWKITPEYYKFSTFFRNRFWILFCYQTTGR